MRSLAKAIWVFLFLSLLILKPTPSFAWWHGGHDHGYIGVNLGVWPGYYGPYYGHYYDPYYPDYVLVSPSTSYQPVIVNGTTYYVNNGAYYLYTAYGYQSVPAPVGTAQTIVTTQPVVSQPAVSVSAPTGVETEESFTVNVPNAKGGYTSVLLKPSGKGFVGPQGEFYAEFPKVSQLKLMYGK